MLKQSGIKFTSISVHHKVSTISESPAVQHDKYSVSTQENNRIVRKTSGLLYFPVK